MKKDKKDDFLEVLRKALGNVSVACKSFGIDRQTYYNWCKEDPEFAAKCEEVKEVRKDFIESALDKRIQAGDTAAIIFAAKTICKDRGYVERVENEVHAHAPLSFVIEEATGNENTTDQETDTGISTTDGQ